MVQKLKLISSNVVFQDDKITKVEIEVEWPAEMWMQYCAIVHNDVFFTKRRSRFSALAKKYNDDDFDPIVGISIAEARAWIKAKKHYRRCLKELHKKLFAIKQDIVETAEDLDSDIAHNIKYISRK